MKFQYGTLIFTGRHTGKMNRKDAKELGIDPQYVYLGSLNRDRTVVETVIAVCQQQSNCNAYEVYMLIKHHTRRLIASGTFYREFPDKDADFEYMTLEDVRRHLSSVLRRSREGYSKFIPRGIARIPNTEYVTYSGMQIQEPSHV